HLLVVEDDEDIRGLLCGYLREQHWRVTEAADGLVALEQLRRSRPDVILVDLLLPRMNGLDLIEQVRRHPDWRTIPILVVTAADLVSDQGYPLQGHVEEVLRKGPYTREELFQEIRSRVANLNANRGGQKLESEDA